MSQELERVYTINLGKVLLSQSQHRAVRAINMIREFARHHMKTEDVKIEEDLAHQIWARGVRSPPRKIRVRMTRTDEGYILVSPYEEEIESEKKETKAESKPEKPTQEQPKVETKLEEPKVEEPAKETKAESKPEKPTQEQPKVETKLEEPKVEEPAKETKAESKPSKEKESKKEKPKE